MNIKALAALLLVILFICCTFIFRVGHWWAYTDAFCLFMGAFMHLLATLQPPALALAARRINRFALWFVIAGIVALIVEIVVYLCLLG